MAQNKEQKKENKMADVILYTVVAILTALLIWGVSTIL